jgi:hypothetical protein
MSMLRIKSEREWKNRTFMPRGTGMGMADPSNQMQMNKEKKTDIPATIEIERKQKLINGDQAAC